MSDVWAIVLAAGSGRRFGRAKQFERVAGQRLVDRAIDAVRPHCSGIVLVLPPDASWDGPAVDRVVAGGATHAASTHAAVAVLPATAETVLITAPSHPLASATLFAAVTAAIDDGADAAAPLLPLADAVKTDGHDGVRSVRTTSRPAIAQLPFALRRSVFEEALRTHPDFVEELALVEHIGGTVVSVPGEVFNIHVTTPADIAVAEALLSHGLG